jgi:hypothetical protein
MYPSSLRLLVPLALSLSLGLTACSPQPVSQPAGNGSEFAPATRPAAQVATQKVNFTYTSPAGFKTQVVNANDVKFIKLTLVGDGVNGTLSNEGGFIPVTGGTATASILNVPIQPGKVRVATVQGYDANQQALPAFVGKGYYTSRSGQATITITISRRQLLVGQTLERLLMTNPSLASSLDLSNLQNAVDLATGFDANTKKFTTDPTLFDPQKLANKLAAGESPSQTLIQNNATATAGNVQITVNSTGGGKFTEALTVEVNDPKSTVANINLNATSPQQPSLSVSPGTWTVQIKKANGSVVGTTTVTVASNGQVTLGNASFQVTLKPEVASLTPGTISTLGGTTVTLTGTGFTGATAVKFGNTNATNFTVNSNTQITATAPAVPAGNTNVTVTTPGGSSDTAAGNQVTYANPPAITGLSASSGTIGSSITINGTHFNATHGNNVVRFGTTTATTTAGNATSLTVNVPAGISGAQDISVQDGPLTSANTAADNFAVVPTVTGLNPTAGALAGGGTITVTGTGFATGATTVKFDTTDATNVNVTSNTSLTATIPAATAGQQDVTVVTTGGGTSATSANSKYTYQDLLTQQTSGTTEQLYNICFANNLYVAIGQGGTIVTSANASTWTSRTSGTATGLRGVAFGNNTYVTVGLGGVIVSSPDGTTWTTRTSGTGENLESIVFANNQFLTTGGNGTVLTSPDGITWTSRTSGVTQILQEVIFGNGLYVAVGLVGRIITSPDGITWTTRTSGTTNNLIGATFGNNQFVTTGGNGTVLTSPDGITWTSRTSGTTSFMESVVFGNNKLVAMGSGGTFLTSPDGITWTTETSGTTASLTNSFYDGGKFVVVGSGGSIFTSNGL